MLSGSEEVWNSVSRTIIGLEQTQLIQVQTKNQEMNISLTVQK